MQRILVTLFALALLSVPAVPQEAVKEVEPNDLYSTPQVVVSNGDVAGTVGFEEDADWFRFEVKEPTWVRVRISGAGDVDFSLTLHDLEGTALHHADGQPAGKPEEIVRRVRRGATLLMVRGRTASPGSAYTLSIREVDLLQYKPSIEQIKAAIRKGLAWLATKQAETGAWPSEVSVHGVTGLSLMAFLGEGLPEYEPIVAKAAAFFTKGFVPPGANAEDPRSEASSAGCLVEPFSRHLLYEQAIAVLALSERYHATKDAKLGEMVKEGVALLVRSQNTRSKSEKLEGPIDEKDENHGGWRYLPASLDSDLSASGWCLIALVAASKAGIEVPDAVKKDYMPFCRRCFDEDRGMYGYRAGGGNITNTTNAVGVLTTLLCMGGECPVVRTGLRNIRKNLPVWNEEGEPGLYPFYYWYYGSRAMYVAGGDWWKEWEAVMCPLLLDHQNADGSWTAAQEEEEVGTAYSTAMAILILQLMSGNPPAYLEGLKIDDLSYPCPVLVDDIEALLKVAAGDDRTKEQLIREIRAMIGRYRGE
ncbi:MAG: hypothetical protein MUE73_03915 [Planctomycetes bacterium]|jgi:hypothetical protein|nr:hypothetical protein [Planctomycetota bacterium]